jgi:hypothetical protein
MPTTPEIPEPSGLPPVQPRQDGRGRANDNNAPPPRRIVQAYQEADRSQPADDRITILGIPINQITASTRAALAALVAEITTLRAHVRRLEGDLGKPSGPPVLGTRAFLARLDELLAAAPPEGAGHVLVLVHVQTYEDIRRSSGLLSANGALAEVAHRLHKLTLTLTPPKPTTEPATTLPISAVGFAGGLSLALLVDAPLSLAPEEIARAIHVSLNQEGYDVGGLGMALAMTVTGGRVETGESALSGLARVDHISRSPGS